MHENGGHDDVQATGAVRCVCGYEGGKETLVDIDSIFRKLRNLCLRPIGLTLTIAQRSRLGIFVYYSLQTDPPTGVAGSPLDSNIMVWQAVIFGPDDTPWEGGAFKMALEFTEEYPNKAPNVRFLTKLFHPNIYNDGQICLDILQNQWSPIYDISAILTSIQSLLCDPNPASPANSEASRLYNENRREYNRRVRQVVEQSWEGSEES